ncbi:MAG: tRNA (guanosine(46)-N7)-methyltransferase TrmB [Burkholderiales bacterium]
MRTIKSYALREGRISAAQARACRELLPKHGISYRDDTLDFARVFGRFAPTVMEIGFGMGEALAEAAGANPARDYLGIEVYSPGVGSLLNRIEREGLTNLKIIQHDAAEVLRNMIGLKTLHGLHVFFPDPWPKKRHHKRRLVNQNFVALACDRLAAQGYIHLTTDWQSYAEEMFSLLSAEPRLKRELAKDRPRTKFEIKGERAGRKVWDLLFVKAGE